jgi:hypothetical protein
VRDLLEDQSSGKPAARESMRKPRSLQLGIWVFAFSLIAFGLFCIASIPAFQSTPPRSEIAEPIAKAAVPPLSVSKQPEQKTEQKVSVGLTEPSVLPVLPPPSDALTVGKSEVKAVRVDDVTKTVETTPAAAPLTPTSVKPAPISHKVKSAVKAAQPKIAIKQRHEMAQQSNSPSHSRAATRSETSSSQGMLGTSSGMPSQTIQSTQTSNQSDACYGTSGLAREQCQQCDSRSGWLFKLNCESQVKTKFCSGREGKHVECPPSYNTPG